MLNNNKTLSKDAAKIFFVWEKLLPAIDADFYFSSRLENKNNNVYIKKIKNNNKIAKNSKLIFYIDCFIGIQHFCILFDIVIEVIAVAYRDEHPDFAKYYKNCSKIVVYLRLSQIFIYLY